MSSKAVHSPWHSALLVRQARKARHQQQTTGTEDVLQHQLKTHLIAMLGFLD